MKIKEYTEKFVETDKTTYVARCKSTGKEYKDYLNTSGCLIRHIKELGHEVPSLFKRNKYFEVNGKLWVEEYFDIVEVERIVLPVKKCPYCDWETIDVTNKSGWFEQHLNNQHGISKIDYLKEHPEEREYFTLVNKSLERAFETDETKFIRCKICGKKLARIDWKHLQSHGITQLEYKQKYENKVICDETKKKLDKCAGKMNITLGEMNQKDRFVSKPQREINDWLNENGIETELTNRKLLQGKEIDIYIPSKKIGIEFNGNKWHTEWFGGKTRYVHLQKTEMCNELGIGLIQVFEDEYEDKELFYGKLSHILGINKKPVIGARKCTVSVVQQQESCDFLDKYHIQGSTVSDTFYYGAKYNDKLVAVMTFKIVKKGGDAYNLTRYATSNEYSLPGVASKLLKYFINAHNPKNIISFADRRWTLNVNNNLYTQLGFKLVSITKPDYKYFNCKDCRLCRFHKFGFRKDKLSRKYGLDKDMTETEMVKSLGYDRIWDCGLFKYELCAKG